MKFRLLILLLMTNVLLFGQCGNFANAIVVPTTGTINNCNNTPPSGPATICADFNVSFSSGNASFYWGYIITNNGVTTTTSNGPVNSSQTNNYPNIVCVSVPCGASISFFITAYSNPNGGGNICNGANATVVTEQYNSLPIVFLDYSVISSGDKNIVTWTTASESNNAYFTIERSANGHTFDALSRINGAGNSAEAKSYTFVDEQPLSGTQYYRIKQTDFDGKFSYSNLLSVTHSNDIELSIFPNPASSEVTVLTPDNTVLKIYDMFGKIQQVTHLERGKNIVDLSGLYNGIYTFAVGDRQYKILKTE